MEKSLGLIEVVGLTAAIEAADAACKTADVELIGYERAKGGGMITVKVVGQVGAVKAAVTAAQAAAGAVNKVVSCRVIARPDDQIAGLISSKDTVGVKKRAARPAAKSEESKANNAADTKKSAGSSSNKETNNE